MKNKICELQFTESAEQQQKLVSVIEQYKDVEGAIMPILQHAQEIYGYLPIEVLTRIASALNVPMEEIYGVATFYSQFSLNPRGKYNFSVCLGTACYVRGSGDVMARLKQVLGIEEGGITKDGMFSIQPTRCVGCCGLAPVMTVNDEVYGKVTPEEVEKIVAKYKQAR